MKFKYLKIGDKMDKDLKAPKLYYFNSKGRKILYNAKYNIHFFYHSLAITLKGPKYNMFFIKWIWVKMHIQL